MTNQEAISVLESINAKTDYFLINDDARAEAIDMAISALQAQDLQSTCNNLATDTISRQAAIEALDQIFDRCEEIEAHLPEGDPDRTGYKMYPDYMTVWKYLHQLPFAQPEIIRCKDCKWWSNDDYRECSNPNYDDGYVTPAGFYCGYAERRADESD